MATSPQRYRVIKKLDTGGMAEIYLGEMQAVEGFKKRVVIKRVLPRLTRNKRFVQMFLDEARLSLALVHANIVQVFDVGRADETYFIVMEFVDGLNLRAILESLKRQRRHYFPVELALFVTAEALRGLAYAHDKVDPETGRPLGIVHRDISPPNTLISRQGEVKLVDFGLAKATNQVLDTDPGVVKGKFSYLAPEAALGQDVDARSDLYGVAIVLFEMLTGRRLFLGETDQQTLEQVRQARVPPMAAIRAEITPDLEQIMLKALAKDPDERYQTAYEFADALTRYLFAHSLHVTSRDLQQLVQRCMQEAEGKVTGKDPKGGSVMEALIQQEILRFTSIEGEGGEVVSPDFNRPAPPVHDPGSSLGGDFIDTRTWLSDMGGTGAFKFAEKPAESPAGATPSEAAAAASPPATPTSPDTPSSATPSRPPPPPSPTPPPLRPQPPAATPAGNTPARTTAPQPAARTTAPQPAARKSSIALYSVLFVVALVLGALTAAVVHFLKP